MSGKTLAELEAAVAAGHRDFGAGHPETLRARVRLALGYREGGRDRDARAELEDAAAVGDRELGRDHPDTLAARHELALTYFHLGIGAGDAHLPDAIAMMERVADGRGAVLGAAHPDTLRTLASLSLLHQQADRYDRVRELRDRLAAGWAEVVARRERQLGPDEPDTQFARIRLASAYRDGGRRQDERELLERVTVSWERLAAERARRLGPMHPDTIDAREHHAYSHRQLGRADEEVALVERITADHERLLGPTHPRTLHAQVRLASRYFEGHRDLAKAIALGERIIDEVSAVLGPDDDLRSVRGVLFLGYTSTGRPEDAAAVRARYPLPGDSAAG